MTDSNVYGHLVADPRENPGGIGSSGMEHSDPMLNEPPGAAVPVTDLFGGFPLPDDLYYGDKGGTEAVITEQGEAHVPTNLLPGFPAWYAQAITRYSRGLRPDGHAIYGVILPPNVPQQVVGARPGQWEVLIWNVGSTQWGSNIGYLTSTYGYAQDIADNVNTAINGFPLPVIATGGQQYKHESEAPLFGVSPVGTLLVVSRKWWRLPNIDHAGKGGGSS